MKWTASTIALLLLPMTALAAPADGVSYHPVNLLDNNPTTLWCAHYREGGVRLQLQTLHPRSIDRIVLVPAPRGGKTVDVAHVSRDGHGYDVSLVDGAGEQALRPTRSRDITVSVRDVSDTKGDASLGGDVFCLAEIALYDHGERIDASELLVTPEGLSEQVVGGWHREGDSHKAGQLTFNLDGTWQMTPPRGKKPVRGTYVLEDGHVVMRRAGRRPTRLLAQLDHVAISGAGDEGSQDRYSILVLRGTGDAKIDGKYVVRNSSGY